MSSSGSAPDVSVFEGTKRYDFYDTGAFREYLTSSPPSASKLLPYLDEFKSFPQVDDVLITYFDECIKSAGISLRLAPSILVGSLSELLVLRLLKAVGDYLEDPNTVDSFREKRKNRQRQLDYTRQLVRIGEQNLEADIGLSSTQRGFFHDFYDILGQVFNSIKLRRNDCVHPEPDMTLNDLPNADVISSHVTSFNPYAKILLNLINIFTVNT